jgi:hypothetical protein
MGLIFHFIILRSSSNRDLYFNNFLFFILVWPIKLKFKILQVVAEKGLSKTNAMGRVGGWAGGVGGVSGWVLFRK